MFSLLQWLEWAESKVKDRFHSLDIQIRGAKLIALLLTEHAMEASFKKNLAQTGQIAHYASAIYLACLLMQLSLRQKHMITCALAMFVQIPSQFTHALHVITYTVLAIITFQFGYGIQTSLYLGSYMKYIIYFGR